MARHRYNCHLSIQTFCIHPLSCFIVLFGLATTRLLNKATTTKTTTTTATTTTGATEGLLWTGSHRDPGILTDWKSVGKTLDRRPS